MGLSYQEPGQPQLVPYMDLGGGLNTRLDPHALARNELAVSQNLWSAYDSAVTKRPGSSPLAPGTGGATGSGLPFISLWAVRLKGQTILIACDTNRMLWNTYYDPTASSVWVSCGSVNASATFITVAQMFDPLLQTDTVFICDGYSVPWYTTFWAFPPMHLGALHTIAPVTGIAGSNLPPAWNKPAAGPFITPQFVKTLGNNSHLFYSGEPSNPDAVYVSDPFYPTKFTNYSAQASNDPTQSGGTPNVYYPAVIGSNDGVDGGPITGIETIGSVMVVFKESAIYTMIQTTLLGEVPAWQVVQVSTSSGCNAPRSIARFPTFIVFLSIDGVYLTDGQTIQKISGDVPTYFDGSLTGNPPLINVAQRGLAIGVRHGNRYELFFCTMTTAATTGPQWYNNMGVWFDFDKQSRFNNPIAGEIDGMNVGGACTVRGNGESGNVAWASATADMVAEFGVGHADMGPTGANVPIQATFVGKADFFDDTFGPEQLAARKQMQDAYLVVEVFSASGTPVLLNFSGAVIVDLQYQYAYGQSYPMSVYSASMLGTWGTVPWGSMVWGSTTGTSRVNVIKIPMQNVARGYCMQVAISEQSTVPWIAMGYGCYVNPGHTEY